MDDEITHCSMHWWQRHLEERLKKLIHAVTVLAYSRSDKACAQVAELADDLEDRLWQYQSQLAPNRAAAEAVETGQQDLTATTQVIDQLLLLETHQLIAEARRQIGISGRPGRSAGNVVELRRNYSDLADAEFERLLAASDVERLYPSDVATVAGRFADLSGQQSPTPDGDTAVGKSAEGNNKDRRGSARLTLVYSDDTTITPPAKR